MEEIIKILTSILKVVEDDDIAATYSSIDDYRTGLADAIDNKIGHLMVSDGKKPASENETKALPLNVVVKVERTRCPDCKKPKWRPSDKGLHKNVLCKCSETTVKCVNCGAKLHEHELEGGGNCCDVCWLST